MPPLSPSEDWEWMSTDGTLTVKLPPAGKPDPAAAASSSGTLTLKLPPVEVPTTAVAQIETPAAPPPQVTLAELVSEHASIQPASYSADCLARAVYFESRGEPLEGQLAVAEVVINRSHDPRWHGKICDVVRKHAQFSFVHHGVIPHANIASKAWSRAVAIAHIAMTKLFQSPAQGSLFYHAKYASPSWRYALERKIQLGRHIFYH